MEKILDPIKLSKAYVTSEDGNDIIKAAYGHVLGVDANFPDWWLETEEIDGWKIDPNETKNLYYNQLDLLHLHEYF